MILVALAASGAEPDEPAWLTAMPIRVGVARALAAYEIVAWATTDALVADGTPDGLDGSWFVLDPGGGPVGYYGRIEDGHFVQVRAYRYDGDGAPTSVSETLPARIADARAQAAVATRSRLPAQYRRLARYGVNPNLYVLERDDLGLDVWVLPSLDPDGRLALATCGVWHFDASGTELQGREVERRAPGMLGMGPSATARFDSVADDGPTVCELYWTWLYSDDFDRLSVRSDGYEVWFEDIGAERTVMVAPAR